MGMGRTEHRAAAAIALRGGTARVVASERTTRRCRGLSRAGQRARPLHRGGALRAVRTLRPPPHAMRTLSMLNRRNRRNSKK